MWKRIMTCIFGAKVHILLFIRYFTLWYAQADKWVLSSHGILSASSSANLKFFVNIWFCSRSFGENISTAIAHATVLESALLKLCFARKNARNFCTYWLIDHLRNQLFGLSWCSNSEERVGRKCRLYHREVEDSLHDAYNWNWNGIARKGVKMKMHINMLTFNFFITFKLPKKLFRNLSNEFNTVL